VAGLEIKNVGEPDETRPFAGRGQAAVVNIAGHPVMYMTYEPGWRWSEHLKPIVGTDSCQATHLLSCLAGCASRRAVASRARSARVMLPRSNPVTMRGPWATSPAWAVDFGSYVRL
jgi:hypothetical protein